MPAVSDIPGAEGTLVPGAPVTALICAYPGQNSAPGGERLAGTRTLEGEHAGGMARDLAFLPVGATGTGACTAMGGPMTNYLIRFTYADGRSSWVGSADEVNKCTVTTNGTAASNTYVGDRITAAYRNGTWTAAKAKDPCTTWKARRGQDTSMVPEGATSVTVCRQDPRGGRSPRADYGSDVATSLASALNALEARSSEGFCEGSGKPAAGGSYRLVFGYPDGPAVGVMILLDCRPAVDSGLLQADVDDRVIREVTRLAPA
ncbi:hypothetical protein ACFFHJ_40480 [Planotetraspora thailandica]|uniref:hypothetical protein n=1 Tax=Planotetraspora thailandica TaxID=487172 RepID=UPI001950E3F1|nr:hypothetical protein [Planotetraspora thailandica]